MKIADRLLEITSLDLKRKVSWLSFAITYIAVSFLSNLGDLIFSTTASVLKPFLPSAASGFMGLLGSILHILTATFEINLLGLIIFVLLLFPIYRKLDSYLLRKTKGMVLFRDNFNLGKGDWQLNYWGSKIPQKTNRIEEAGMVFEASPEELEDSRKEFGAYLDLTNGIYQGNTYEVECVVAASRNATMEFLLWLHDTRGGNAIRSDYATPTEKSSRVKLNFIASSTNALRIHLHNKAGEGKIFVKEVTVRKV